MNRSEKKKDIALLMLDSCFNCHSEKACEVMLAFADYVGEFKLNRRTAPLFLRILAANEPAVVDSLLKNREPFHLFRNIRPNNELLRHCFEMLSQQDPISIYRPVLLSLLGILSMAYKNPSEGNAIRKITLFDLNHIAKYLDETRDQTYDINRIILQLLEYFYYSEYELNPDDSIKSPGIHSMRLRFAFFDKESSLREVIPEQLLSPDRHETHSLESEPHKASGDDRIVEDFKWAKTIPKKEFPV